MEASCHLNMTIVRGMRNDICWWDTKEWIKEGSWDPLGLQF